MTNSKLLLVALAVSAATISVIGLTQAQPSMLNQTDVLNLDVLEVESKYEGPEAVFILSKEDLQFEGLEPKKSFLPLIIKSVEKEPF